MVPEQVLRAARVVAAGCALAAAGASEGWAEEEPAVLVDLRPEPESSGGELARALAELPELELRDDPALTAALAGAPAPGTEAAGELELERARDAYGELDCERAQPAAARAALHLAAARAADPEREGLRESLERAHVYELLCADAAGDLAAAQLAAARLRNLGASSPPAGVSAELWERVPQVDATADVNTVPLSISTEPSGAEVWVDHVRLGAAPREELVAEGTRLVAAGKAGRAAAALVEVEGAGATELALEPVDERWESLREAIAAWRDGREPSPVEISNFLQRLDARVLVVRREGLLEVWARAPGARVARQLGDLRDGEPEQVARIVAERVAAWEPRRAGPEPGVPLLREDPAEREARDAGSEPAWWVYASILGAIGVGAAFVIASDLADDRQRIELTWP